MLGVMNTTISRLRQRYKPKTIKVLFVAESPPAESPPKSLDEEVRFFYNPRQERWDHMYRSVMKAVFPDFEYRFGEKDKWLRRFSDDGYYMIDATDSPVNRLSSSKRRFELNAAVDGKLSEIAELISSNTPIILIKKNVFLAFSDPLRGAGYKVIHESFFVYTSKKVDQKFENQIKGPNNNN